MMGPPCKVLCTLVLLVLYTIIKDGCDSGMSVAKRKIRQASGFIFFADEAEELGEVADELREFVNLPP
jgi:hypothetical protein